jgi:hypothetical protein
LDAHFAELFVKEEVNVSSSNISGEKEEQKGILRRTELKNKIKQ